jgi:hypothetical protein
LVGGRQCSGDFAPAPPVVDGGQKGDPMSNEIGVGMLGYEFMGRAHSAALRRLPSLPSPPPLAPRLVSLAGRNGEREAADA